MHQAANVQFERARARIQKLARGPGAGEIAAPAWVVGSAFEIRGVRQPMRPSGVQAWGCGRFIVRYRR